MSTPILALRAALRAMMTGTDLVLYDEVRDAVMPYASFGDASVRLWSDDPNIIADHKLSIHIWSRAPGDAEALDWAGRIATRIETAPLDLTPLSLVSLTISGHEMRRPTREGVRQAILRLTAITELRRGDA